MSRFSFARKKKVICCQKRSSPSLLLALSPCGKVWILEMVFQITIKIRSSLHPAFLASQSRFLSKAILRSRADKALAFFRIPWTRMIRRPFVKK